MKVLVHEVIRVYRSEKIGKVREQDKIKKWETQKFPRVYRSAEQYQTQLYFDGGEREYCITFGRNLWGRPSSIPSSLANSSVRKVVSRRGWAICWGRAQGRQQVKQLRKKKSYMPQQNKSFSFLVTLISETKSYVSNSIYNHEIKHKKECFRKSRMTQ